MLKTTCPSCGAQFFIQTEYDEKIVQNSNELVDRRDPQFIKQPGIPKGLQNFIDEEKRK